MKKREPEAMNSVKGKYLLSWVRVIVQWGKALALPEANLGSLPNIPYAPHAPPVVFEYRARKKP